MGRWLWSAVLVVVLVGFAWVIFETPAIVSAGIAIAVACGFSAWLDRKPAAGPSAPRAHNGTHIGLALLATLGAASGTASAQQVPGVDENVQLGVTLEGYYQFAILKPVKSVTWTVNYYFGQEQPDGNQARGPDGFFRVFDTYAAYSPTQKVSLAADVNYVTNEVNKADAALSLQGAAVYARYQVSGPAALAVRYERLDDEGLFGGIAQVLHGLTATAEYKFAEGFLMRGEFRRDWSNEHFFTGREPGDLQTHQNTLLAGLVWWFGNKHGAW